MNSVYSKVLGMLLTIGLGSFLRHLGILDKKDAAVISKIMLNVTLPAMIIGYLNGLTLSKDILTAVLCGLAVNLLFFLGGFLRARKNDPDDRAVKVFSSVGMNIGGVGIPVLATVASAEAMAAVMAFNYVGTPIFVLGIAPSVCAAAYSGGGRIRPGTVLSKLFTSTCGITCFVMLGLSALHIVLPPFVMEFCTALNNANNLLAMLVIGILLELKYPKGALKDVAGLCAVRFGVAAVCAALIWFFLPVSDEIRRALTLVCFVPLPSPNPALALASGYRGGRVAAVMSLDLLVGLAAMSAMLVLLYG